MLLLSFRCLLCDRIQQFKAFSSSSGADLCFHSCQVVFCYLFISPNQIKFLDVFCNFSFPALSIICVTCTDCMFFCSIETLILVDASFMSSFAVACLCFCSSSAFSSSLSCWRSESFYFSAVSFPLAPFQAPLLYVIQLLSEVAVHPNTTDNLSEPFRHMKEDLL